VQLRAVQSYPAHLHHAQPLRQQQGLHKQAGQGVKVPAPEPGDRPEVRRLIGGQEPKRDIIDTLRSIARDERTPVL